MSEEERYEVRPGEAGERLDRFLVARTGRSRSVLQRWLAEGRVAIDGVVETRSKAKVRAAAVVALRPAPPPVSAAVPQPIDLEVLHEDEHLLVVVKAPGMVVHPAPGHPDGTLVNALLHRTSFSDGGDPMRPGIVHRLDKDTSGVLVVARTAAAREGLVALFKAHDIERRYDAIVLGDPPAELTFDTLHGRHPVDRKRFSSRVTRGKRAVTHLRVKERLHGAALVRCRLETGRTHQIRVHLADAGMPVLGDPVYARTPRDPRLRAAHLALGRQALHASVLGFVHPVTGVPLRFEAPLPSDFRAALEALRR